MAEHLWSILLQVYTAVAQHEGEIEYCSLRYGQYPGVSINGILKPMPGSVRVYIGLTAQRPEHPDAGEVWVWVKNKFLAETESSFALSGEEAELLNHYLPYCLLPLYAHRYQRAIAITHFAQSLDGKIATHSGDSKWIGNNSNLVHAHRMRAICDGILIGRGTLLADQPALTVRRVPGPNPVRIVVSSSAEDFTSLLESSPESVLVIGKNPRDLQPGVDFACIPGENGRIDCKDILSCLYQRGIYTVYIEGGAQTTSNFLHERAVDIVQLHIAPRIFGSGVSGAVLPEIALVEEALSFEPFVFLPAGDSVMFVGELTGHAS